jgi:polyisoprenoid-binding protein YceI
VEINRPSTSFADTFREEVLTHLLLAGFMLAPGPGPILIQDVPSDTAVVWTLDPERSEARYRVREQLAGFDFPNDAVGSTSDLTGIITLDASGAVLSGDSEFRIQLASLRTDNERRDRYVRGRTLEVEQYPEAILVPRRFVGLDDPSAASGTVEFQLEADLTLHGQTRPTVWEVTAEMGEETITGFAATAFPFHTFDIAIPQVARVLSVDDNIRLELDFHLVRQGER